MKGIGTFLVVGGVIAVGVATAVVAFRTKDAGGGSGGGGSGGGGSGGGGADGGAGGPEGTGAPKPSGRGRYAIRNPVPDGTATAGSWSEVDGYSFAEDAKISSTKKLRIPLTDLPDGAYMMRVSFSTATGTLLCFDVSFPMDVVLGRPIVNRNAAGYIDIRPENVAPCVAPWRGGSKTSTDLGVQGWHKVGSGTYASVNARDGSHGPAYAVDIVDTGSGIALELRAAKDWRQRVIVNAVAEPLS